MPVPIHPVALSRHIRRLLGGAATIQETAFEREVICPGERAELRPTVFLPAQIDKIFGTPSESNLQRELDHALRRSVTHEPTLAYHIKNATLFDGSIYAQRLRCVIGNKAPVDSKHITQLSVAAICSSLAGSTYFGHWLADDVVTHVLAGQYGGPLCCSPNSSYEHRSLYAQIFEQNWTPVDRAHIDHLVLFQDFAQTSHKKQRQLNLRMKLLRWLPTAHEPCFVYLKRGSSGVLRSVSNEDEIIEELSRRGFVILDIQKDSLECILSHLASAKVLVSVEGSQAYHGAYSLPSGSGLLLLQPPGRFTATQRGWSENIGVGFGFVVGDDRGNSTYFSPTDILKTIDLF